jgi:hypothetical protein
MARDHLGVKVTRAAGRDLLDWKAKPAQSIGIVLGLNVTRKDSGAFASGKRFQSTFQEAGFSGSGRTDQVQAQNSVITKVFPQISRKPIVFAQNLLLKR